MKFILKSALLLPLSLGFLKGATIVSYPPDGFGITLSSLREATPFLLTSAADINQVSFWIGDNPPSSPVLFKDISWAFYANTVGSNVPGTILNQGTTKPSIVFTGACPMFCIYRADLNLPMGIQLASGTYWVELHEGLTLDSTGGRTSWRGSSAGPGSAGGLGYVSSSDLNTVPNSPNPSNSLLSLELSEIPEPATLTLMLVALTAIRSWGIHKHRTISR